MTNPTQNDDPTLLERWRAGDRTALDQLLGDVLPWLHREMSKALGDQVRVTHDSMDLAQSAVMNFLHRGPRFVPATVVQFRALLKRIAHNELIDQWRRQRRNGAVHLGSMFSSGGPLSGFGAPDRSSLGPERQAEASERMQWVRLALQFLPADDRQLLLASQDEDIKWEVIGEELGLSGDAARMREKRLKPKLANLLRKLRAGELPDIPPEPESTSDS
ncbi:MAG: sigma-70 family RNA polymerase sigma factor [Planctomycetota bacterium]